jgi:hypothetical protein
MPSSAEAKIGKTKANASRTAERRFIYDDFLHEEDEEQRDGETEANPLVYASQNCRCKRRMGGKAKLDGPFALFAGSQHRVAQPIASPIAWKVKQESGIKKGCAHCVGTRLATQIVRSKRDINAQCD